MFGSGIIAWVLSKVFTGLVTVSSNGVLNTVLDFLKGRADTQAQVTMAAITGELEARKIARDVRLATAGFWEMRLITFIIAAWFTLHLSMVAFDTLTTGTRWEIIGWNVAPFPAPFNEWEGAILLSFFGLAAATRVGTGILAAVIKPKG
jgi:hypothetical protein